MGIILYSVYVVDYNLEKKASLNVPIKLIINTKQEAGILKAISNNLGYESRELSRRRILT